MKKKILFGVGLGLLLLCVIGIVICYVVFPTQTKDVYARFIEIMQQPLPVAGISITMIISGALMVISKTSFGKAMLAKMTIKYNELEKEYNDKLNELKELEEKYRTESEYYKEILVEVIKTIPNKKVQAIAEKVENYGKETKEEIDG